MVLLDPVRETKTISLPVKKHVKAFLIANCGYPINLKGHLPDLHKIFIESLTLNEQEKLPQGLTEKLNLVKPYEFRWYSSFQTSGILLINNMAEQKLKAAARSFIALRLAFGCNLADSIKEVQKMFSITDDIWSLQTIKKDYSRHEPASLVSDFQNMIKTLRREVDKQFFFNCIQAGLLSLEAENRMLFNSYS